MMEVESRASDESILWFALQQDQTERQTARAVTDELIEAIAAFLGQWISPLTVGLRVECRDPGNYDLEDDRHPPSRATWFLRRRQLDERLLIQPSWSDSQELQVDLIGSAEVSSLIEAAFAQSPPLENLEIALAELEIAAVEVALPEGLELKLLAGDKQVVPVLRQSGARCLAQGPDYNFVGPPVSLRASNRYGSTRIVVEFFWDFWLKHAEGLAQVHASIERVLARGRGWKVTEGNLPPPSSG